jgi:hypothetical protein
VLNVGVRGRTSFEGLWRALDSGYEDAQENDVGQEQSKCNGCGHTADLFAGREGILVLFLGWLVATGRTETTGLGICCVSP